MKIDNKGVSFKNEVINGYTVVVRKGKSSVATKTIILVHGIGVASDYFTPLTEQLEEQYIVIAVDLPGYGKAPRPPKALNLDELTQVLITFLAKHKFPSVTLIGHSMGCQIVAEVAAVHPELVNNMILLSPTVNHNERTVFLQGLRLLQDTLHETPRANAIIFSDYIRMGVKRYFQTAKYMVRNHIENYLRGTTIPTLIIRGERDPIVPAQWVAYLVEQSPFIHSLTVASAPHALHLKFPQKVAGVCRSFIG